MKGKVEPNKKKPHISEMTDLTPQQRLFVLEYRKDHNGTKAAIRAGYSGKTADVQASRLLASVKIKKYLEAQEARMEKDLREMFADHAVNAFDVMIKIMNKEEALDRDRLRAAADLLDRAGYKPMEKIEHSGETIQTVELTGLSLEDIKALAMKKSIDTEENQLQ